MTLAPTTRHRILPGMAQTQVKWDSKDYRSHSSAQFAWAMDMISRIGVREDSTILDIGCGDGRITRELARIACRGRVVGIDTSPDMIALARSSFPDVPNLRFEQMDARNIDLPERFTLAFSNATLHWIKEQDQFLASLRKHMATDGMLHFNFGGRGNAQAIFEAACACAVKPEWIGYFLKPFASNLPYAFLGDDEYLALLAANGFAPEKVCLIPKDMTQDGAQGLAGWIRTTWMPVTGRVPEALREKFIGDIVDEYLRTHPLVEGKAVVKMVRLEVHAKAV
jgi:trans-aconitate 2-methyltransferase